MSRGCTVGVCLGVRSALATVAAVFFGSLLQSGVCASSRRGVLVEPGTGSTGMNRVERIVL